MFRPAARFLTRPRPPDRLAARFLAAVILPPLLFFAIVISLITVVNVKNNAHDTSVRVLASTTGNPGAADDSNQHPLYLGLIRVSVPESSHVWSKALIPVNEGQR